MPKIAERTIIEEVADMVWDWESAEKEARENDGMIQRYIRLEVVRAAQEYVG